MMRHCAFIVFSLILFTGNVLSATYFTGNLTSAQEVPPNTSTASGFGRVTLNDAGTQIAVSVYYSGLTSGVTAGHIHGPAAPGANGPVLFNLNPTTGVTSGSVVNATFAVTAQQVADLKAGLMYFNIHTANNTGGEIRGQLFVDSPFIAYMNGGQENPPVNTSARGAGVVSLNSATNQALVSMTWTGLSGNASAGHVHTGRSGTNGSVVCNLSPAAAPSGSVTDVLCNFTSAQAQSLRTGQFYLNIHTAANPGGEIRGQIQRRRSTVLDFNGDSKTDFAIARNNTTGNQIEWWILNSAGGISAFPFGASGDFNTGRMSACDFDGDGKDDPAIWRTGAQGVFLILESLSNVMRLEAFGTTGDDPRVVYDYDGDGRCDPAVFRSSDDTWYYLGSSNNAGRAITYVRWGTTFANPGDFDGDGRGDFADQQGGIWWILRSSDLNYQLVYLGTGSMFGTPGDYDGDGKTDIAGTLSEGSSLAWYYASSMNPGQSPYATRREWGPSGGTRNRAQGDYDGDGKSDYAVWIEGATNDTTGFWVLPSSGAAHYFAQWGISTTGTNDFPIAGYNNR